MGNFPGSNNPGGNCPGANFSSGAIVRTPFETRQENLFTLSGQFKHVLNLHLVVLILPEATIGGVL